MKNTLVIVLIVLLVLVIGVAVYFYINSQSKIKTLQSELEKIQIIKEENDLLKEKIAQALSYVEYVDILMLPFLKDIGVTPRFNFSDEMKWVLELEKRGNNFNNSELDQYLDKLRSQDQKAFGLILNWAIGEVEKILK